MQEIIEKLSDSQKDAVNWDEGPMMVLAGPGVGKTTVLTARLATILQNYDQKKFRLLALTYTTKAADEMKKRVESIVPDNKRRLFVGTFHSFCAKILRQHGSHIGIRPDFSIFDQIEDRIELLQTALKGEFDHERLNKHDLHRILGTIDQLRRKVIGHDIAKKQFCDASFGDKIANIYQIYEKALLENNASDFNGLILNSCRLIEKVPMVGTLYRSAYKYWFIDEFQDTTVAQYKFLKLLSGENFNNIFAVADDDQIIFQWAGASFDHIERFKEDFNPKVIQLVENRRCPSEIISLANSLIKHNTERIVEKKSLIARMDNSPGIVDLRVYPNEMLEASETAKSIAAYNRVEKNSFAVLGRTQAILEPVLEQLKLHQVKASLATRRDSFVSPHFNWLLSSLELANKPNDRGAFICLTNSANLITGTEFDPEIIIAEPLSTGVSFLEHWVNVMKGTKNSKASELASLASQLVHSRSTWRKVISFSIDTLLKINDSEVQSYDIVEDREAWKNNYTSIVSSGPSNIELHEFLHGMRLRSKEPPASLSEVRLFTIHSAKGLEFDHVWMIGMADSILPSWYSLKEGAKPQLLEEERRACFVGMTRVKKTLSFSCAQSYQGFPKHPSRFLHEMGLI